MEVFKNKNLLIIVTTLLTLIRASPVSDDTEANPSSKSQDSAPETASEIAAKELSCLKEQADKLQKKFFSNITKFGNFITYYKNVRFQKYDFEDTDNSILTPLENFKQMFKKMKKDLTENVNSEHAEFDKGGFLIKASIICSTVYSNTTKQIVVEAGFWLDEGENKKNIMKYIFATFDISIRLAFIYNKIFMHLGGNLDDVLPSKIYGAGIGYNVDKKSCNENSSDASTDDLGSEEFVIHPRNKKCGKKTRCKVDSKGANIPALPCTLQDKGDLSTDNVAKMLSSQVVRIADIMISENERKKNQSYKAGGIGSFIFYSEPKTLAKVYAKIMDSKVKDMVEQMKELVAKKCENKEELKEEL